MRISQFCTIVFLLVLAVNEFVAQSVMVIPFYKEGDNKQLVIENDPCYRIIETKIKAAFLSKDFSLLDFRAVISRLENVTGTLNLNSQSSIVSTLTQNANPDIYIIADIERLSRRQAGKQAEFKLTLNLTAHRTFNGQSLSVTILDSGWRYYDDCLGLVTKAFHDQELTGEPKITAFTEQLLGQTDPEELFVSVGLEFSVAQGAEVDYFTSLSDGRILAQAIDTWIKQNSIDNRLQSNVSDKYIKYSTVRMQLEGSDQFNSTSDVAFALLTFLRSLAFTDTIAEKPNFTMGSPGNNLIYTLE